MTELQEVTIQYINCPDPVESAARGQRVEESDERGDMEETTARIIANAQATRAAMLPHTTVIPSDSTIILGDSQITAVWDQLAFIALTRDSPWFLTGDFNEIIDNSEKSGGPERPESFFGPFRSFLSAADLFDLQHTGNFLSWRGKQGTHLVDCRLDRSIANSHWSDMFPTAKSHYLEFENSDHRPLLSTFEPTKKKPKRIFRIASCRRAIAMWSRKHYINSRKTIDKLKTSLDAELSKETTNDSLISSLNTQLLLAYKAEEEYWKQRSRQLWLTLGDKNTGFFHASTRGRRARNQLTVLENAQGEEVFAIQPSISHATNEKLTYIPSAAEIKEALFSIHPDKAPGPDGFSASFFQSNWSTVNPAIIKEIQDFFATGVLPSSIYETHIRLIPKTINPKKVVDYRLIALCNVYYKIISKLLSLRLKPVLEEIISENQSAFIPGRSISENVLITHEILHFLKTSDVQKKCSMAVKTDISKAYDRLEWNLIEKVLLQMGFHSIFVNWVMQCITTVTYSFLINEEVLGHVVPSRGIRQGDPISPYVFIHCGEVLSGMCKEAQRDGSMTGIRIATKFPRINHLLFADDTLFFVRSNPQSCLALKDILQKYERASGQMINTSIEKEGGAGKYLGLPELFGRKKKDLFASIVDRIKQRAVCWSSKQLSAAGKLTLLKSILTAIPTFSMTCFLLPVGLCKKIQSILTRFFWDGNDSKRKICWISWDNLTKPKSMGVLGFRDIQHFNKALLDSYGWLLNRSGEYSSKSGYLALHLTETNAAGTAHIPDDFNWYKSVWSPTMLPKIQLFLWKVLQGAISTGENLQRRGLLTETNCIRCGAQETTNHIFFHCDFERQVWKYIISPLTITAETSFGHELQTSRFRINLPPIGVAPNLFHWIAWTIWTSRNLLIFENRTLSPTLTMTRAIASAREWTLAHINSPSPSPKPIALEPRKSTSPNGTTLIFTDASWIASTKQAGLAWISTDANKQEINRGSLATEHIASPLLAESLAVRASLLHASTLGYTKIWIHSDSQELVRLDNGPADRLAKSAFSNGLIGPNV
ncbi:uncharacterized protein LOC130495678 [Raphanus sativus]|uniref:Uncharacterized protein LOC130495678 n=1 Tax=Raphanus sativus TaxID=3726 RepID=A0A9W3BUS0_RAPSA|nr:uncharacterized protein LOC130495678 [Raphanus sativus]